MELHLTANGFGNVFEVILVARGQHDFSESCAVSSKNLLLDSTNGKDFAL